MIIFNAADKIALIGPYHFHSRVFSKGWEGGREGERDRLKGNNVQKFFKIYKCFQVWLRIGI